MFEKHFKVKVSMGDGKPIEDVIPAKTGVMAMDLARDRHPGARSVYILGIHEVRWIPPKVSAPIKSKVYKPMDDILCGGEETLSQDDRIRTCLTMKKAGHSQETISGLIGVSRTTVRRWLQQYG